MSSEGSGPDSGTDELDRIIPDLMTAAHDGDAGRVRLLYPEASRAAGTSSYVRHVIIHSLRGVGLSSQAWRELAILAVIRGPSEGTVELLATVLREEGDPQMAAWIVRTVRESSTRSAPWWRRRSVHRRWSELERKLTADGDPGLRQSGGGHAPR